MRRLLGLGALSDACLSRLSLLITKFWMGSYWIPISSQVTLRN